MLFKVSSLFLYASVARLISQGEGWDSVIYGRMTFKLSIPKLFYLRQTFFKRVFKNICITF